MELSLLLLALHSSLNMGLTHTEDSDFGDESDSGSDTYMSYDSDFDPDGDKHVAHEEYSAREVERQRVLNAAGLILKRDRNPPPRPPVRKPLRRRRPPPAPKALYTDQDLNRDIPPTPISPTESSLKADDAYDKYELFKQNNSSDTMANRLSMASTDTAPVSPASLPLSLSPSRDETAGGSHRGSGGFLHIFSRGTHVSSSAEKRSVTSISGPIIDGPSSSNMSGASESQNFGNSWSSLVDSSALEGIPPVERKRQEAIFELINTEGAYVRDLQLIVEKFYAPMLSLLDDKETNVIFANVEELLLCNTALLSSLEERQKECRLYIDKIGDVLEMHVPNLHKYLIYCTNQSTAIKVLQSLRLSKPEVETHLLRLRDDPSVRNLDLSSYLLAPMQRITRYPLLLRQIHKATQIEKDKIQLESSIRTIEGILANINETIRDQEGREILKAISADLWIGQGQLDLTAPTRFLGPRKLIKEGLLSKAKSGRRLHAFLCSDILVLTDATARSLYRMPIPLSELHVRGHARDSTRLLIELAYPRGGDILSVKASSMKECQSWIRAIDQSSSTCRKAEQAHSTQSGM